MGALARNLGFILQENALSKAYKEDGDKIRSRHKKGNSGDKFSRLDRREDRPRTRVRRQRHESKVVDEVLMSFWNRKGQRWGDQGQTGPNYWIWMWQVSEAKCNSIVFSLRKWKKELLVLLNHKRTYRRGSRFFVGRKDKSMRCGYYRPKTPKSLQFCEHSSLFSKYKCKLQISGI